MKLDHLILTRFCVRLAPTHHPMGEAPAGERQDPLGANNLDLRLRLLQIASLSAVRAQSAPDVGWVVIVDPLLPPPVLAKLQALLRPLPRAHVHVLSPQDDIKAAEWLDAYVHRDATHLLTTNLDDDDLVPVHFAQHCRAQIEGDHHAGRLPPVRIIGTHHILQWDLCPRPTAPLGWVKPWVRGSFPSACGLSLLTPRADPISVLAVRHRFSEQIMDLSIEATEPHVHEMRDRFAASVQAWPKDQLFYDFGPTLGPVLMSNHFVNLQATRRHEAKDRRSRVRSPSDLAFPIDWAAYARHALRFTPAHPKYWTQQWPTRLRRGG